MNNPIRLTVCTLLLAVSNLSAATLYVSLESTNPTPPYATWATAATNIQDAVDAGAAGDEVVVTNGIYTVGGRAVDGTMTNRVTIHKPLTVSSVNGPQFTLIRGYQPPGGSFPGVGAIRCAYLTNGACLSGFTLTNGSTQSGYSSLGDVPWPPDPVQCGGAAFGLSFPGVLGTGVVISNCVLVNNGASAYGGGAYGATLLDCTVSGSWALGGGAVSCCSMTDCLLTTNVATVGGGVYFGWLANCILAGNRASNFGGGAEASDLYNCTVVGNQAPSAGGIAESDAYNCILYYNTATNDANFGSSPYFYCCTPQPFGPTAANITNAPLFVDLAAGDLHLQSNSPCINAGTNSYATGSTDLDGNPRIVGGTVDIGAYECQSPALLDYFTWLQGYGLSTYAAQLYADSNGSGMNNWEDWVAGLNPTNALSVLKMLAPASTTNPAGLVVTWESVNTRTYYLQRSTNLAAQPAFSTVQRNIVGQTGTTSYTDTNATNAGPYFYRVGVGN